MTLDEEAHLTAYMRVIEFMRKNEAKVMTIPGMKKQLTALKTTLHQIFELLTDEERDTILERYKEEMAFLKTKLK